MTRASRARARSARVASAALVLALAIGAAGCASDVEKIKAINAVNEGFRAEYERLLAEKGSRIYAVSRAEAFVAMRVTLAQLGMAPSNKTRPWATSPSSPTRRCR